MKDTGNIKNLLISGVVVMVVGVFAFFYISRDTYVEDPLLTGVTTGEESVSVDGSFLSALNSLRRIKLDDSVFQTKAWGTLTDFGRTLAPQPYGRPNPFAPVGGNEAASAQSVQ